MALTDFLHTEMIWVDCICQDSNELFKMVTKYAINLNLVTDSFLTKLIHREEIFPTGIKLRNYGVAIPHTDPECIKTQFVGIAIPSSPVAFNSMENETQVVEAEVIFILGLNEPHNQLKILQQIMKIIQNEDCIRKLILAKDKQDVYNTIEKILSKDN